MERERLELSPELRTPPTGAGRRTSGWGQAIEHGPGTTLYVIDLASSSCVVLSLCATSRRTRQSGHLGRSGRPLPSRAIGEARGFLCPARRELLFWGIRAL